MLAYNQLAVPQTPSKKWTPLLFTLTCLAILLILTYRSEPHDEAITYGQRATVPPAVRRPVLDKLRLLDLNRELTEEFNGNGKGGSATDEAATYENFDTEEAFYPTRVHAIPVTMSASVLLDNAKNSPSAPIHLCPESSDGRCRFLIPAVIGEQETKAQLHLYQLGLLSIALGRRLVLPRISKSRMGTCGTHSFSLYYDTLALSKLGIPSITYEEFIAYSIRNQPPTSPRLTAQVISVGSNSRSKPLGSVVIESTLDPTRPSTNQRKNLCLNTGASGMQYDDFSPVTILPPSGWFKSSETRNKFGRSIIATLDGKDIEIVRRSSRREKVDDDDFSYELPDVIVMHYESRWAILEPESSSPSFSPKSLTLSEAVLPFSYFNYAAPWISLADLIVESMGPFIGIHWRTETVPAKNLYSCADGLISTLIELKSRYPLLRTVYLATDYPIESITLPPPPSAFPVPIIAHSGTFTKSLSPVHAAAFRHLVRTMNHKTGLILTGYKGEEQKIKIVPNYLESLFESLTSLGNDVSIDSIDSGLTAILDKLIVESFLWIY